MDKEIKDRFEKNPDDINAFKDLSLLNPEERWIFSTNCAPKLSALGLSMSIYSDIRCIALSNKYDDNPSISSRFPNNDTNLARFLLESSLKQDIIKPFGNYNIRQMTHNKCYTIKNAKVICSKLSICILDSEDKIVQSCSHNSPESLLIWYHKNKPEAKKLQKAGFASAQQTFNLGHWFIDSLSRIISLLESSKQFRTIPWLVDTTDHILVKKSLHILGISKYYATLPFSVFQVETLYIPVVNSFNERAKIASSFLKQNHQYFVNSNPPPKLIHGGKQIFLSRQGQKRRRISNWIEIKKTLDENNIDIIEPEKFSLNIVGNVLKSAEVVIAPNGAAVCNTLMCSHNTGKTKIIYPDTHIDDYYYRVSEAMGRNFAGILSKKSQKLLKIEELIDSYYYPSVGDDYCVDRKALKALIDS